MAAAAGDVLREDEPERAPQDEPNYVLPPADPRTPRDADDQTIAAISEVSTVRRDVDFMMKRNGNLRKSYHESARNSYTNEREDIASMGYPLMVVPVEDVLNMDVLLCHEELRERGLLTEWTPGMESVIFFSHTWLASKHPDRDGVKFELLQALLRSFVKGQLEVRPSWSHEFYVSGFGKSDRLAGRISCDELRSLTRGYVWMDYMSIPQRDAALQSRAIVSIPHYVSCAHYFVVLTGAWAHRGDGSIRGLSAWLSRGWCRMELLCNALASRFMVKPVIVARGSSTICSYGPSGIFGRSCFQCAVGEGAFVDNSDREALGPVILELIKTRKRQMLGERDLEFYRILHAGTAKLLAGTGLDAPREESLDEWLQALYFRSASEHAHGGLTPLHLAAFSGRHDIVDALLRARAPVDARIGFVHPRVISDFVLGASPLDVACQHADVEMVQLLYSRSRSRSRLSARRFNLFGSLGTGMNALHHACSAGLTGAVEELLAHDPSLAHAANRHGSTPIKYAIAAGQVGIVDYFREHHPRLLELDLQRADGLGFSGLLIGVAASDDVQMLETTLGAGSTLQRGLGLWSMRRFIRRKVFAADVVSRLRRPNSTLDFFAYATRCTPLHIAAYLGDLAAVAFFVDEMEVDTNSKMHPKGMTPIHLAAMGNHRQIVRKLLVKGADLNIHCNRGWLPYRYARMRNHDHLADILNPRNNDKSVDQRFRITRTGRMAATWDEGGGQNTAASFQLVRQLKKSRTTPRASSPPLFAGSPSGRRRRKWTSAFAAVPPAPVGPRALSAIAGEAHARARVPQLRK